MKVEIKKTHTYTFTAGRSFTLDELREFIKELGSASGDSVITAKVSTGDMRDPTTTTLTVNIK